MSWHYTDETSICALPLTQLSEFHTEFTFFLIDIATDLLVHLYKEQFQISPSLEGKWQIDNNIQPKVGNNEASKRFPKW